ncbi:MAG: pentapeptide repeat-containing protein [Gallionella sp.]|nr:pentapeptide repeat-containing protein [Gallionella sp.]MDD4959813.1 pentapeptide repeat-containing protein [Gallionella sp.]
MTTPDTPAKKVPPEILHLDETGYGYDGTYTREKWRAECLMYFEAGADAFLAWQKKWQALAEQNQLMANFEVQRTFNDGSKDEIKSSERQSYCIDFAGHTFENGIRAKGYQFLYEANFQKATITGFANFENARFRGYANFSHAIFTDYAYFLGTKFKGVGNFGDTTFTEAADFFGSTFTNHAYFKSTNFNNNAYFQKVTFKRNAYFGNTVYPENEGFRETTFKADVRFGEAIFTEMADFASVSFEESVDYLNAKFHSQVSFRNTKFKGRTNFENAEFTNVGHFEGAKFNAPTSKIPSFRGVDIGSTLLEFSDDTHFTQADFSEEAIKNIAFLKHLSEQHGQIDQALNFNAMELRAKRLFEQHRMVSTRWEKDRFTDKLWFIPVTWLYGLLSDFGRSYMRPLLVYVAIFVFTLGLGIYFATEHKPQYCQYTHAMLSLECDGSPPPKKPNEPTTSKEDEKLPLSGWRAALEYANYHATGMVDFTGDSKLKEAITLRLFGGSVKPWRARQFGTLLSIINTALLFLIALGLRNKYRLK